MIDIRLYFMFKDLSSSNFTASKSVTVHIYSTSAVSSKYKRKRGGATNNGGAGNGQADSEDGRIPLVMSARIKRRRALSDSISEENCTQGELHASGTER